MTSSIIKFAMFFLLSFAAVADINFNDRNTYDFNLDGVNDRFIRKNHGLEFEIRSGKDNTILYKHSVQRSGNKRILLRDYSIVRLDGKSPSIVFAAHKVPNESFFPRYTSPQKILVNNEGSFKMQTYPDFQSGAFSVSCSYAKNTFGKGHFSKGAFCFFAAYGVDFYTRSALVHFDANGEMTDVTNETNLPWYGGVAGTPVQSFPRPNPNVCGNPQSYEKWHLMGIGWLDFNNDGAVDFVTSGQHTRSFSYQQVKDHTNSIGFSFKESPVTQHPGEFLVIGSEDPNNPNKGHCFYQAVEAECGDHDALYCYEGDGWRRRNLPVELNQNTSKISMRADNQKMYFKLPSMNKYVSYPLENTGQKKEVECREGSLNGKKCIGSVKGYIGRIKERVAKGWACLKNSEESIRVHLYAGEARTGQIIGSIKADLENADPVLKACGVNKGNFRFQFKLTNEILKKYQGQKLFAYGINPSGPNLPLGNSGLFSLPKPEEQNGNVKGYLDRVKGQDILGWTCLEGSPDSLEAHIYAGAPASEGGKFVGKTLANKLSEDAVRKACGTSKGQFRYSFKLDSSTLEKYQNQKIYAYGVSAQAPNKLLSGSGKVHFPEPKSEEKVIGYTGLHQNHVVGWACVEGEVKPTDVHVYVGGAAGKGGGKIIGITRADRKSEDPVRKACRVSEGHFRFVYTLTDHELKKYKGQPIFVHGINPNGKNLLLNRSGKYTVP